MGCTCLQRRQRYSGVIEALGFSQSEARTLYGYFAQADVQCRGDITLHELWKFLGVDRTGFTERVRRNAVLCRWQRTGAWLEHVPSTSIREAVTCITLTVRALTGVQLVRWRWQWHRGLWRVPGVAVQLLCVERGPRRVPRRRPLDPARRPLTRPRAARVPRRRVRTGSHTKMSLMAFAFDLYGTATARAGPHWQKVRDVACSRAWHEVT